MNQYIDQTDPLGVTELTDEQLNRQDFVDGKIMELVNELVPVGIHFNGNYPIMHDQEFVGPIRDKIMDFIRVKLNIAGHIPSDGTDEQNNAHFAERKRFEYAFYPWADEDEEEVE